MNTYLRSAAFTIATVVVTVASPARAEDFYVGASIAPSGGGHIQYLQEGASGRRDAKDRQIMAGLFAGYQLSQDWALEGGFRGFGGSTSFDLDASHQFRLRTGVGYLAAKRSWALGEDWAVYGKAGVARGSLKASISGAGAPPAETWHKTGLYLGAGLSYRVSKNIWLQLELEHSDKLRHEGVTVSMDNISLGVRVGF